MTVLVTPGVTASAAGEKGYPLGWWGMVVLIATEAMVFAALLSAYFFTRASSPVWPQGDIQAPELTRISIFTILLLASSIPLFFGEAAIRAGHVGRLRIALFVSFLMGAAFLANQVFEFRGLDFGLDENAYASLFIVTTGLHGLHVLAGLLMSVVVQLKARLGQFDENRHLTVSIFTLYWHFVDVVWIFVFSSLYLSAHLS
jgi:cytochrome c oxidase subunit III